MSWPSILTAGISLSQAGNVFNLLYWQVGSHVLQVFAFAVVASSFRRETTTPPLLLTQDEFGDTVFVIEDNQFLSSEFGGHEHASAFRFGGHGAVQPFPLKITVRAISYLFHCGSRAVETET